MYDVLNVKDDRYYISSSPLIFDLQSLPIQYIIYVCMCVCTRTCVYKWILNMAQSYLNPLSIIIFGLYSRIHIDIIKFKYHMQGIYVGNQCRKIKI